MPTSRTTKNPPWDIVVYVNDVEVSSFQIPNHRLEVGGLHDMMRAIFLRYWTDTPEEMSAYYLNKRSGLPIRSSNPDVRDFFDHESRRKGFLIGAPGCYVSASMLMDQGYVDAWKVIEEEYRQVKPHETEATS